MIQLIATEIHKGSFCMTAMITARVDAEKKKGGLKLGIAEGKYKFPPNFDERFDAMDAEVAELFS